MKTRISFNITFTLLFIFTSCADDFLNENPRNIIAPENLYINKAGFEFGLNGLYNRVRYERNGANGGSNVLNNSAMVIGVDNAYSMMPAGGSIEAFLNTWGTTLVSTDGYLRDTWEWLYGVVNAANTIIIRAENPDVQWSLTEKNQVLAEAKLIRAWAYRHLTFLFGAVPLNLEESSGTNIRTDWERTPVSVIRTAMENDLLFAEQNLSDPAPYDGRVSKAVASHYLAELYLTVGKYQAAKDKASSVVNNALYGLTKTRLSSQSAKPGTPFTDMFLDNNANRSAGNKEVLWVLQNEYLSNGGDGNIMRRWYVNRYAEIQIGSARPVTFSIENGGRGLGRFGVTKYGLSIYDNNDDRGSYFGWRKFYRYNNSASLPPKSNVGDTLPLLTGAGPAHLRGFNGVPVETVGNTATNRLRPSITKWDYAPSIPEDVQNSNNYNDQIYLRVADTYLLLAEAQFYLNDLAGAAATINLVRARANATPITASQVTLDFILDERSRELWSEEHRRYTLLRTGTWFDRTKKFNLIAGKVITLRDTIFPIPQVVIDANLSKTMSQNPGW